MFVTDLTDTQVFTALRAFIIDTLGTNVKEVVRIPTNRVPLPKDLPFITMSPTLKEQIRWPDATISDPATQPQSQSLNAAYRCQIQVDAYGSTSGELIQILSTVLQSEDAFDFFASYSIQGVFPIYADTPRQLPLVDSEAQYEVRLMMDVSLQYNPTVTTTVQTASTATVDIINVEAAYH